MDGEIIYLETWGYRKEDSLSPQLKWYLIIHILCPKLYVEKGTLFSLSRTKIILYFILAEIVGYFFGNLILGSYGQLGYESQDIVKIPQIIDSLIGKNVIAVTDTGNLYSWGRNNFGQVEF